MKNYRSDEVETADVPTGQVRVDPHGSGWYLIQIGRGRYTKRFNLSDAEIRQLIDKFADVLAG